jgi:hypothetical protein
MSLLNLNDKFKKHFYFFFEVCKNEAVPFLQQTLPISFQVYCNGIFYAIRWDMVNFILIYIDIRIVNYVMSQH